MFNRGYLFQYLFQRGVESKIKNLRIDGTTTHPLWDRLAFNQWRDEIYGGRIRFFICSAAALDIHLQEMMQVCYINQYLFIRRVRLFFAFRCCKAMGRPNAWALRFSRGLVKALWVTSGVFYPGQVGDNIWWLTQSSPHSDFCLESVPEMEADARGDPPRGEILLRGPGLAKGYFRREQQTNEVFTEGGWWG